jgi:hypothetical protein
MHLNIIKFIITIIATFQISCEYFFKKIIGITDSSNQVMISFDVDNLYSNVPVNEAIEITLDMLYKRPNPPNITFTRIWAKSFVSDVTS